jgi:hypothetical protein
MVKIARRVLLLTALGLLLLYAGDFALAQSRHAFGVVKIERYYAIPQKDGKTEFVFAEPETEECVHSLFPHLGDSPCWYVNRHTRKRINM